MDWRWRLVTTDMSLIGFQVSLIDSMDVVDVSSSREGEDICFRRLELNAKQQSTDDKGKCCIVHLR